MIIQLQVRTEEEKKAYMVGFKAGVMMCHEAIDENLRRWLEMVEEDERPDKVETTKNSV